MLVAAVVQPSEACVDENALSELFEGRLSPARQAEVEAHLAGCAACRQVAALARASGATQASGPSAITRRDEAPLQPGTCVGRYVILEQVGAGAMGTVYAAHDPDLDRRIALKLMRRRSDSDELRGRVLREGKAMARLVHPEVITVYDVGTYGAQLFVAMEFVAGGTLRAWLARERRDWRDVLAVFRRAGGGLACAHAAGLVHRDFKPDNVLVGADGRVRVTDFGLARAMRSEPEPSPIEQAQTNDVLEATLTRTGALVGTPAYMAPEQLFCEAADARADVFSFCVALYEALYGARPFAGSTLVALRSSIASGVVHRPPPGSPVPDRLRRAILVGLRARPEDRYASMEDLLRALDDAARSGRVRPRLRRVGLAGGAALIVAASVIVLRPWHRAPPTTDPRPSATPASAPAPAPEPAPAASPSVEATPGSSSPAPSGARRPVRRYVPTAAPSRAPAPIVIE
jgi:serine/threonine protein kinase